MPTTQRQSLRDNSLRSTLLDRSYLMDSALKVIICNRAVFVCIVNATAKSFVEKLSKRKSVA